jgi:AcrR family transcriptional regulator
VLLYLFGSKDDLVVEILRRARREQLDLVAEVVTGHDLDGDPFDVLVERLWAWLSAPRRRPTIRLFFEAYVFSLRGEPGPWQGFAEQSVADWLDLLRGVQPHTPPDVAQARATHTLALLRGLLLDLLACEQPGRVNTAMRLPNRLPFAPPRNSRCS